MIRRTELKRSTKPLKRTAVRKKRPGPARRVSVVRDKAYLAELRMCYCEIGLKHGSEGCCFMTQADPAHGPVNGAGSKGGDDGAIALCRRHHREQHRIGWPAFEKKYGIDRAAIAAKLYAIFKGETS